MSLSEPFVSYGPVDFPSIMWALAPCEVQEAYVRIDGVWYPTQRSFPLPERCDGFQWTHGPHCNQTMEWTNDPTEQEA